MKRSLLSSSSTNRGGIISSSGVIILFLVFSAYCCFVIKAAVLPWRQQNYDAQGSRRAPFAGTHYDYAQPLPPITSTFEYASMSMIYHSGWNRFLLGTIKVDSNPGVGISKFLSGMITVDALTGKVVNGGFTMENRHSLMAPTLLSTKGYLYVPTSVTADFQSYSYLFVVNTLDWSLSKFTVEAHSSSVIVESVKCYLYVKKKSMKCLDLDNPATVKWAIDVPEAFSYSDSASRLILVTENNEEIVYYNGMKSISKISPKQAKVLATVELGNVIKMEHTGLPSFVVATVRTENAGDSLGIVHVDAKTSSFSNGIGLPSTTLFTSVTCVETPKPNTFIFKTLAYVTALGANSGPLTKILYHFSTTATISNSGVVIEKPQLFKTNELKSKAFPHASVSKDNCQVVLYKNGMYNKLDVKTGTFIMMVGSVTKGEAFDNYMLGADNGRVYTIVGSEKTAFESITLDK